MNTEQSHVTTERVASPASRAWARLAVAWAWLFLLVGCGASLITVARGGYSGLLLTAISCACIAAFLLAFAMWRGGVVCRVIAALGIAPFLFVVTEFIRRY